MNKQIPISQLTAWLIVAVSAPVLSFANQTGWLSVACAATICVIIGTIRICLGTTVPKWVGFVEIATIVLYLGAVSRICASCWKDSAEVSVLPLALLCSAAFAARKGAEGVARSGAALLWFIVPGICLVLFAGTGELNIPETIPVRQSNIWIMAPLFLLPFLGYGTKNKKHLKCCSLLSGWAIAVTVWLNAEQILPTAENAFYEYSKGITLFGVAERFEAVSACLLTAGWFSLLAFLLGMLYETVEAQKKGMGKWGLWIGSATTALIMYKLPISVANVGVLCVISWGLVPVAAQLLVKIKKSKNY